MTRLASLDPDTLLQHLDFVQRLARDLLRDAGDAEDLSQEAMTVAMEKPPRHGGDLRHWLAIVTRRLAANQWRAGKRRRRHEQASARQVQGPSAAEVLSREETRQRVVAEVLQLDEPYRSVVLLRYFDGLSSSEIARRHKVPANRVRVRLHRGLQQLRRRMDAAHGGDRRAWIGPLGAGLCPRGTLSLVFGGLLVKKVMVSALVVLVCGLWALQSLRQDPGSRLDQGAPVVVGAPPHPAGEVPGPVGQQITKAARSRVPGSPGATAVCVLRGCCLDGQTGLPLAGCAVQVQVVEGSVEVAALSESRPGMSRADGRFELRLDPSSLLGIRLRFRIPGYSELSRFWPAIRPGAIHDLGEVRLFRASGLGGRIEDARGRPLAGLVVRLERQEDPDRQSQLRPSSFARAERSGADGRFAVPSPLFPGTWVLRVAGHQVLRGGRVELRAGERRMDQTLVVRRMGPEDYIQGQVLDPQGRPIAGVRTRLGGPGSAGPFAQLLPPQGQFFFARVEGAAAHLWLRFAAPGYEPRWQQFVWGATRQTVVLQPAVGLEIEVRRVEDATVIEDYQATLLRLQTGAAAREAAVTQVWPRRAGRAVPGSKPDGLLRLLGTERLPRGRYRVLIEPAAELALGLWIQEFELRGPGTQRVRVVVEPPARRRLRLLDSAGQALAGSLIDLCRPLGTAPVTLQSWPLDLRRAGVRGDLAAMVWRYWRARTDAEGWAEIVAQPGLEYCLRAMGPGHRPLLRAGLRLAAGQAPLELRARSGARIHGSLRPAVFLARLRNKQPEAGNPATAIGLTLEDVNGHRWPLGAFATPDREIRVAGDGSFSYSGLAAGDYRLFLEVAGQRFFLQAVDGLVEGESRQLDLRLEKLLPARLSCRVFVDGKPAAHESLGMFRRMSLVLPGRGRRIVWKRLPGRELDAQGAAELQLAPGSYQLLLRRRRAGLEIPLVLSAPLELLPGAQARRKFELRTGSLRLRLLGEDGKQPLADCPVALRWAGPGRGATLSGAHSDAQGWVEIPICGSGRWRVLCVQAGLLGLRRRLELGQVEIQAGQQTRAILVQGGG